MPGVEQVSFVADVADGQAGSLDNHNLLHHLLFATSSEVPLPGLWAVDLLRMSPLFLVTVGPWFGGNGLRTCVDEEPFEAGRPPSLYWGRDGTYAPEMVRKAKDAPSEQPGELVTVSILDKC